MYTDPSVADFKAKFARDFPYGTNPDTVNDSDITSALNDTTYMINPALFENQGIYTLGFLLLAAHFMVMNLRASSQGLVGSFEFIDASKSVGSVSESQSIPQRILDNPEFSMLAKTNYGAKYLFLILPLLSGQMFIVRGGTQP